MKHRLSVVYVFLWICGASLLLSVATSCHVTTKRIPADRFQEVLRELFLTDLMLERDGNLSRMADSLLVYPPILEKHGYTAEQFLATLDYYTRRPARFKSLLARLRKSLNQERTAYNKKREHLNRQRGLSERFNRWLEDTLTDRRVAVQKRALRQLLASADTTTRHHPIPLKLPADSLSKPTDSLGKPTDSLGKPTDSLGKPTDSLGKPTDSLGRQADQLSRQAVQKEKLGAQLGRLVEQQDQVATQLSTQLGTQPESKVTYWRVLPVMEETPEPGAIPLYLELAGSRRSKMQVFPVRPERSIIDETRELEEVPSDDSRLLREMREKSRRL